MINQQTITDMANDILLGWTIIIPCALGLIWVISNTWEYLVGFMAIAIMLMPLAMLVGKMVN
tara:strand:- start:11159 stop:11344 length:186 start_codon:yes stop_codon:yes gene_type:complete